MSASPVPVSAAVGDYIPGREIGRGSFATVFIGRRFHARHPSAAGAAAEPTLTAIKTVNRDKLNRKLAENLESEIKILTHIDHPNIVRLFDIVKTDKYIHLIMEFCSLGDLSAYIKRKGVISPTSVDDEEPVRPSNQAAASDPAVNPIAGAWGGLNELVVRHFLHQLASAVEFLRANSLIHRDIKPQNLLLSPPPDSSPDITLPSPFRNGPRAQVKALPLLKLADFGFARALPQQSLASTLCGSPLYMAPEILRGDRYDAKADLWSVGAVLYETLTGRPPFKAQNHVDLLRRIDKGEGHIRFPGEDDDVTKKGAFSTSLPRGASGFPPSPSRNIASNFTPASLGSSPRFPSSLVGAIGISDDLKDLVRRLLKRNPVERMSFEEFFMHPAVAGGIAGGHVSDIIMGEPTNAFFPPMPISSDGATASPPFRSARPLAPRTSSESLRQLQEAAAYGAVKARARQFGGVGQAAAGDLASIDERLEIPAQTGAHGGSSPIRAGLDHQMLFKGDLGTDRSSSPHSPFIGRAADLTTFRTPDALLALEAPFPDYGIDPVQVFGDLLVPQTPDATHTQTDSPEGGKQDDPGLSSISSLGSIELSDEGDEKVVGIVKRAGAPAQSRPASGPSAPGVASRPDGHDMDNMSTRNWEVHDSLIPATKASFEEYVVVDRKPVVEFNWYGEDDPVAGAPQVPDVARHSASSARTTSPMSMATGNPSSPIAAPVPLRSQRSASGSSLDRPRELRGTALPSPRNSPRSSVAGRIVAAVNAVAGIVAGGVSGLSSAAAASPQTFPHSGGGAAGPAVETATAARSPYSRSGDGPAGQLGSSRVFGSLRESSSQHLFVADSPAMPQHSLPAAAAGAAHFAPPSSPGPSVLPAAGSAVAAADAPVASLLALLNLISLRAHALNIFADERLDAVQALLAQNGVSGGDGDDDARAARDAVEAAADEALTLFIAALSTYQSGMEVARVVWERDQQQRSASGGSALAIPGDLTTTATDPAGSPSAPAPPQASAVDLASLSAAVRWTRERFNDCLDKAEVARSLAPPETSAEEQADPRLSPKTLERLLYEKALDLTSRASAAESDGRAEVAEAGYAQAGLLLEAALQHLPPPSTHSVSSHTAADASQPQDADRAALERFLANLAQRMARVKQQQRTLKQPLASGVAVPNT
ncbi:Serine/threonine-protein kinase ulk2 [Cladochytrium tenue]|nr:Serine/threonine-protein kinase ulk2 [Cladochytrium tenue]